MCIYVWACVCVCVCHITCIVCISVCVRVWWFSILQLTCLVPRTQHVAILATDTLSIMWLQKRDLWGWGGVAWRPTWAQVYRGWSVEVCVSVLTVVMVVVDNVCLCERGAYIHAVVCVILTCGCMFYPNMRLYVLPYHDTDMTQRSPRWRMVWGR